MTSLIPNNLLFDLTKIRCEVVFMNKRKHLEQSNTIRHLLYDSFTTVEIKHEQLHKDNNDIMESQTTTTSQSFCIVYNEKEECYDENALILSNNISFTLFIAIGETDKMQKIIAKYKTSINLINDKDKQQLSHLIIINHNDNNMVISSPVDSFDDESIHYSQIDQIYLKETFKTVLTKILIDNYNQIKKKEKIIVFNASGVVVNKDIIEIKRCCEEFFQIGMYTQAEKAFASLVESTKNNVEQLKYKEFQAITKFLIDYSNVQVKSNTLPFFDIPNNEIEKLYEVITNGYKKAKQIELLSESLLRLSLYYSYISNKQKECLDYINRVYIESNTLNGKFKVKLYYQCYSLLSSTKCYKKAQMYLNFAITSCLDNTQKNINVFPSLIEELQKIYPIYNIATNQITSIQHFDETHKEIIRHNNKQISFWETLRNSTTENKRKLVKRKRIESDHTLHVINNLTQCDSLLLIPKWQSIQKRIFTDILNYHKQNGNAELKIVYCLCLLQTLSDYLSLNEQTSLLEEHNKESNALQSKIVLNLTKFPILVKMLPIANDIKIEKKKHLDKDSVFLYNPWEKTNTVNYSWTAHSFQHILIHFYNPLLVPIAINQIRPLFEGEIPLCFPSNAIIDPLSSLEIIYKILPKQTGFTSIIGVTYEIENTIGKQYVDSNGNGLLYCYENISKDPYSKATQKKEIISLLNIVIHPQIPEVKLMVIDNTIMHNRDNRILELYEYQDHLFQFEFENKSNTPIEEMKIDIYAFKKDDYKVLLEERVIHLKDENKLIGLGDRYHYQYLYNNRKSHKKIEFRFYYKWNSNDNMQFPIKPLCYYLIKVCSTKLLSYDNVKVAPLLSNNTINQIVNNDPRIKQKYFYKVICSKYYMTFDLHLLNASGSLLFDILNDSTVVKSYSIVPSDINKTKEVGLMIDDINKVNDILFKWTFESDNSINYNGKIDLSQLMQNELEFQFKEEILLDIKTDKVIDSEGNSMISIKYSIRNKTKRAFDNLKFYIYLYQIDEDTCMFNAFLKEDILYDGSLSYFIKQIHALEEIEYIVNLYLPHNERINTTSVLIDDSNKIIYLNSNSQECCQ